MYINFYCTYTALNTNEKTREKTTFRLHLSFEILCTARLSTFIYRPLYCCERCEPGSISWDCRSSSTSSPISCVVEIRGWLFRCFLLIFPFFSIRLMALFTLLDYHSFILELSTDFRSSPSFSFETRFDHKKMVFGWIPCWFDMC